MRKPWMLVAVAAGLFAATAFLLAAVRPAVAADGRTPVVVPADKLDWKDNPALPGMKIAVLWGDPRTGPYAAVKRVPAGTVLGLHTHSQDQKTVMISGVMELTIGAGDRQDMTAGSYAFIPGNVGHVAACKAGADCVYFEEQPGPSDLKKVASASSR
jgi:hypothetical protein